MDNNLGDIVYFILIAIVALSGFFGKKNKQKKDVQKKKSIFDELPKSWEEFEEMIDEPHPDEEPAKPVVSPRPVYAPIPGQVAASPSRSNPFGSAEETVLPEYRTAGDETMSYDTVSDFTKLRAKKQVKESVFKKHTTLKVIDSEPSTNTEYRSIDISFNNAEDARKAFLYSEIFQRKY